MSRKREKKEQAGLEPARLTAFDEEFQNSNRTE